MITLFYISTTLLNIAVATALLVHIYYFYKEKKEIKHNTKK